MLASKALAGKPGPPVDSTDKPETPAGAARRLCTKAPEAGPPADHTAWASAMTSVCVEGEPEPPADSASKPEPPRTARRLDRQVRLGKQPVYWNLLRLVSRPRLRLRLRLRMLRPIWWTSTWSPTQAAISDAKLMRRVTCSRVLPGSLTRGPMLLAMAAAVAMKFRAVSSFDCMDTSSDSAVSARTMSSSIRCLSCASNESSTLTVDSVIVGIYKVPTLLGVIAEADLSTKTKRMSNDPSETPMTRARPP